MLLVTVALLAAFTAGPPPQITLATELQKHGVVSTGVDDADREITSYTVASDAVWFAIAYYWASETDSLPRVLRVRTLDRKNNVWRSALLDRETLGGGSALRIARRAGVIYLDLHINPSAGRLVVLGEDLTVLERLYGWSSLILEDGRVLYENSMVHFAPAHPGSVSLYDPRTRQDVRVYPPTPDSKTVAGLIDRSIGTIEMAGAQQVRIGVSERDVVLGPDNRGIAVGGVRDAMVTCNISKLPPSCAIQPKQKGRQD